MQDTSARLAYACEAALFALRAGDMTMLEQARPALRNRPDRTCVRLVDALAASSASADSAGTLVRMDSVLARGASSANHHWNYDIALGLARAGRTRQALAAVRRRIHGHAAAPLRLAVSLRDEGRWALAVGDTAGAIRAFRHHLALWDRPEPSLSAQRDSVRAWLARLP